MVAWGDYDDSRGPHHHWGGRLPLQAKTKRGSDWVRLTARGERAIRGWNATRATPQAPRASRADSRATFNFRRNPVSTQPMAAPQKEQDERRNDHAANRYHDRAAASLLEADYTILIDVSEGDYGVPSRIEDDELLHLVIPEPETFPYAEERRPFLRGTCTCQSWCFQVLRHVRRHPHRAQLVDEVFGVIPLVETQRDCGRPVGPWLDPRRGFRICER